MTTKTYRAKPDVQAVQRSLRDLDRLFKPTARDLAETRVRRAKDLMTAAAQAVISKDANAAALADSALLELQQAQAGLAELYGQERASDG